VLTENNVNCLYVFYTVFYPENDPRGSKHVAFINTKILVVLTAFSFYIYYTLHFSHIVYLCELQETEFEKHLFGEILVTGWQSLHYLTVLAVREEVKFLTLFKLISRFNG
jgi:hypothetical protein